MHDSFFLKYYRDLKSIEGNNAFNTWRDSLPEIIQEALDPSQHGDIKRWQTILEQLPVIQNCSNSLSGQTIEVLADAIRKPEQKTVNNLLKQLKPWRKGPFKVCGITIDSEWRSDLKWDRLQDHIRPLKNKLVLDVGCGNGYHCWRMAGAGARAVIGIDPMLLYLMQYYSVQHYAKSKNVFVLPQTLEAIPDNLEAFDTVFSMGVLYHRKSPIDHLLSLRSCLKPDGELVLETLVLQEGDRQLLVPKDRYAKMKNVWFIPDYELLEGWLLRCGFKNIKLVSICKTLPEEQRVTAWSGDASLIDFLHPTDSGRTIEGYPAPVRAILTAQR